jgi:hypothetical protein
MARYHMEFAFHALGRWLTLSFPSPFLRGMPTWLTTEAGDADAPRAWRTEGWGPMPKASDRNCNISTSAS